MKIKDVVKEYGLSADTLRYYEKIGLIDPVKKDESGHRHYRKKDLYRIEFLKRMRLAGCSIETLQKFVELYNEGPDTIPQRQALLHEQRDLLEEKIKTLETARTYLEEQLAYYDQHMIVKDTIARTLEEGED